METDDPGVKTSDWKEMCDKGQNTMQGHCQEIESREKEESDAKSTSLLRCWRLSC
jgi:hypothetical protein